MADVEQQSSAQSYPTAAAAADTHAHAPPQTSHSHNHSTTTVSTSSLHGSVPQSPLGSRAGDHDLEWGPSHPCYPHLNPHVPLSSESYTSTRIIRIRRDWMVAGDMAPTFSGLYPEILADAGLQEDEFRELIRQTNDGLVKAYRPWGFRNLIDVLLGFLTGWLWDDAGWTGIKAGLREVEGAVEAWNRRWETEGTMARVVGLRRTGYLSLDIQIPTPDIGEVGDEGDEDKEGEEQYSRYLQHEDAANVANADTRAREYELRGSSRQSHIGLGLREDGSQQGAEM